MNVVLSTTVYDYLLDKIINKSIQPGEFVNRRDIASELGVSVAPVLEAMILLENEGLLESIPRKGTRVSIVHDEDVSGALLVREALECAAARIYCGKLIRDNMETLLKMAYEIEETPISSKRSIQYDHNLHKYMIGLCGNAVLSNEYVRIARLSLFHKTNRLVSPNDAKVRKSHVELIMALSTAAPEQASALMHDHLISGKGHLALTRT